LGNLSLEVIFKGLVCITRISQHSASLRRRGKRPEAETFSKAVAKAIGKVLGL
jgi:hypothetical protein